MDQNDIGFCLSDCLKLRGSDGAHLGKCLSCGNTVYSENLYKHLPFST